MKNKLKKNTPIHTIFFAKMMLFPEKGLHIARISAIILILKYSMMRFYASRKGVLS